MEYMEVDQHDNTMQHPSADPLPFARCYQVEALEQAMKQNTIVYLDTGAGKTLVAIMLLRSYSYLLRKDYKPLPYIAVFLVPKVVLVSQQARAIQLHTDLKVGMYWGDMGVDFWDAHKWKCEIKKHEVLVMTHDILLDGLRHGIFKLSMIKVLIMDECHHSRKNHAYACIMKEFYHRELNAGTTEVPRILGLTASLIKSKVGVFEDQYREKIRELENIMHSKVYTCAAESVLAEFVPFSTSKFKFYQHEGIPCAIYKRLEADLTQLEQKHKIKLEKLDIEPEKSESTCKRLSKIFHTLIYCLDDLGLWLALKAADAISHHEVDDFCWSKLEDETIVKGFSTDAFKMLSAHVPSDVDCSIADNIKGSVDHGHITNKVSCLVETLLDYRNITDIRCIVFVERVITAVVLRSLLNEVFPKYNGWKAEYIAGGGNSLHSQTRKQHNEIIEEFSQGKINVIVSTSILEEGLDVQRCNLVIRFDPSLTVDSFIQSRGRARMQNSEYILMVDRRDKPTHSRLQSFLKSGDIMRKESLRCASLPCEQLLADSYSKEIYHVESTGAIVTLSSSIQLIHYYCSHLPSDGYFKPAPRFVTCKEMGTCTLYLPKSCPLQPICIQGNHKLLKQKVCLEACKLLHKIGALTDELLPDVVREAADAEMLGNEGYDEEHPNYFPPEFIVHQPADDSCIVYHCYIIKLEQKYEYDVHVDDIVLAVMFKLEDDIHGSKFALEVERGMVEVRLKYLEELKLSKKEVLICQRFQSNVLNVLLKNSSPDLKTSNGFYCEKTYGLNYILLPITKTLEGEKKINWKTVFSVGFSDVNIADHRLGFDSSRGHSIIITKDGPICSCKVDFSLVCTPHNGNIYCITGFFKEMNANSLFKKGDGTVTTYVKYYAEKHGVKLRFKQAPLLQGRHIFKVQNCLLHRRHQKEKDLSFSEDPSHATVELPPELCSVISAPVSISTLYSFSFVPSIMHRIEALLVAANLKRMHSDHCMQNVVIPTMKLLEAITTKRCHEEFHLESLETLGDSFLKYAACQQLFKTYQNHHEGMLSLKKDKMVSNAALCHLGCDKKLPGFIRNEPFDPKKWIVPGASSTNLLCEESFPKARKMYIYGTKKLKSKTVADAVEALLGAYVSTGGEIAGLLFMDWLGLKVDFAFTPYKFDLARNPERLVNIRHIQSVLNYKFRDPTLLVEALTHGSYMLPEIPSCYQRLEFLGDAVLDYLITVHLYTKYPGLSPGVLTDLRSASVNNDCYAIAAVKAELHKHILHASPFLHKQISEAVTKLQNSSVEFTFGWDCDISFPKVLGDIIESLAGAILVDSGYDKEKVFNSIRPLLEPLVTPDTIRLHPVKELTDLCHREQYVLKPPTLSRSGHVASIKLEVEANGKIYEKSATSSDKRTAKRVAAKELLKILKENNFNYNVKTNQ